MNCVSAAIWRSTSSALRAIASVTYLQGASPIEEAVGSELDSLPGARPGSGVYLPGFGRPSTDVQIANTSAEDLKRLADGDRAGAGGDRP